jgi:3-phosphoglycerate kinase
VCVCTHTKRVDCCLYVSSVLSNAATRMQNAQELMLENMKMEKEAGEREAARLERRTRCLSPLHDQYMYAYPHCANAHTVAE